MASAPAREAIKAQEHDQVEFLLVGREQQLECCPVGLAARLLVGENFIAGAGVLGKRAHLVQRVVGVLTLVFRRHLGVAGYWPAQKYGLDQGAKRAGAEAITASSYAGSQLSYSGCPSGTR